GGRVVTAGLEPGAGARSHVAGVEDAAGAGPRGGVDGGAVLPYGRLAEGVDGHDQYVAGALEGVGEPGGVGETPLPHPHAPVGEALRLARVADADADLFGRRTALEQALDDAAAELSGGSGHDDHNRLRCVSVLGPVFPMEPQN